MMYPKLTLGEYTVPIGHPYIGSGVDARVYDASDTSVMMYTASIFKLAYLRYLGLTINYGGSVKIAGTKRRGFKVELTKLCPLNDRGWAHVWGTEAGTLAGYRLDPTYIGYEMADNYPIHGVMLRFIADHRGYFNRVSWGLDIKRDNYLVCPITGKVFPTDVIYVDGYNMTSEEGEYSSEYLDWEW